MNNRTCILTKKQYPTEELIRFVISPLGEIVPDIARKLPGRGLYLLANKNIITQAVAKKTLINYFTKYLKSKNQSSPLLSIREDMAELIDNLLLKQAMLSIALGRKAGTVIHGMTACKKAIESGNISLMLHIKEAAKDGITKLNQAIYNAKKAGFSDIPQLNLFTSQDLALAFGDINVVHFAILKSHQTKTILNKIDKLHIYRK